jgi:AcrR family transcriptional regulator
MVSKGAETRERIIDRAYLVAGREGLEGLTIGALADELQLSKSGLFAHFGSKEELQLEVLKEGARRFEEWVVKPALKAPRGVPRLKKLFELWMDWGTNPANPGGCIFAAAATELDDQEGRPRDFLAATQRQLMSFLAGAVRLCVEQGHFRADTDAEQLAHELYGIVLGYLHFKRLLRDPNAEKHAKQSCERSVRSLQNPT